MDNLYLDNSLNAWLLAAGVATIVYIGLYMLRTLIVRNVLLLSKRTKSPLDDVVADALRGTKLFFLLFVSLYAGSRTLVMPPGAATALRYIGVIVVTVQAAVWGNAVISSYVRRQMAVRIQEDAASATTINALGFLTRLVFYALLVLVGLSNLGIDITALVAGLGIGGIAVALALQNILGDLFASLSIVLDRPFVIGDFIIVGEMMGTVEYIGLKTTRVRSLTGEQIVFANGDLLSSRLRNYRIMQERRIAFTLGVTYQTPRALLEKVPSMIREAVEAQGNARFDRAHFKSYGAFSLDFETVYYVLSSDYNEYMDLQQAINLDIHRRFEEAGVEFAYPTQTLIMTRG